MTNKTRFWRQTQRKAYIPGAVGHLQRQHPANSDCQVPGRSAPPLQPEEAPLFRYS